MPPGEAREGRQFRPHLGCPVARGGPWRPFQGPGKGILEGGRRLEVGTACGVGLQVDFKKPRESEALNFRNGNISEQQLINPGKRHR